MGEQEMLEIFQLVVNEVLEMIGEVQMKLIELHRAAGESGTIHPETTNSFFGLFHFIMRRAFSSGLDNIAGVTHRAETLSSTAFPPV